MNINSALKSKIFQALLLAGVTGPSAYVATNLTVPSEGFLTHKHNDPVGLPTVCVGHYIQKGEVMKNEYTVDECVNLFVKDWKKHEALLDGVVKVPYRSEWMRGAFADFTFNKGIGNLSSSTLLARLNAKQYDAACEQLTRWVYGKVNGKKVVLKGLEIRATKQYGYCMGNEPADYKETMKQWAPEGYDYETYAK